MRTTLTLDPDVVALLKQRMTQDQAPFKKIVNDALRQGLVPGTRPDAPYRLDPRLMGEPTVPVEKALRLAAELEDEELVRKLESGR